MRILIFFLIIFLYSCGNSHYYDGKSCNSLIKELIIKSGFHSILVSDSGENGTIAWSDVFTRVSKEEKGYTIHLYFSNEDKREVTIAWLKLLPNEKIILDVSIDDIYPDTLILSNDISILQKKGCLP